MTLLPPVERRPLYQQVKTALTQKLINGEWRPGDKLPAESDLARTVGVSLGTLRRATQELVDEGIFERRAGVGTMVSTFQTRGYWNRFQPLVRTDGTPRFDERRHIVFETVPASEPVGTALNLRPGTPVFRMVRHIMKGTGNDVELAIIDENYLIPSFFPQLTEAKILLRFHADDSLYKFYDREFGIVVIRQKCEAGVEAIDSATAQALALFRTPAAPWLTLRRTSYTYGMTPVEYRITRAAPGEHRLVFDLN